MRKAVERVISDLRNGDNLEVYITIFLGIGLAILGVSGRIDFDILAAGILATLAIVAGMLLGIRRSSSELSDSIRSQTGSLPKPTRNFSGGVVELLEAQDSFDSIDILANTGTMYFFAFRDSGVRVKKLRLLLRDVSQPELLSFPSDDEARENILREVAMQVHSWNDLQRTGAIEELVIRYYNFDSLYHFMVVDGQALHFGLFHPRPDLPGAEIMNSFVVPSYYGSAAEITDDCCKIFNSVWRDFSRSD